MGFAQDDTAATLPIGSLAVYTSLYENPNSRRAGSCSPLEPQPGPETGTGPIEMPRVKVGPAPPDASTLDVEIAHLCDLDVASLQARSRNVLRRISDNPSRSS